MKRGSTVRNTYMDADNQLIAKWDLLPDKFSDWNHRMFQFLKSVLFIKTDTENDMDLLLWWKLHAGQLLILLELTHCICAIPTSSSKSEPIFSVVGQMVTLKQKACSGDCGESGGIKYKSWYAEGVISVNLVSEWRDLEIKLGVGGCDGRELVVLFIPPIKPYIPTFTPKKL